MPKKKTFIYLHLADDVAQAAEYGHESGAGDGVDGHDPLQFGRREVETGF
jgi:hypothetical protein